MRPKELIAAVLVFIMLLCLLIEAGVYVFISNPSRGQKRIYNYLDKLYCFCLFLICALVVAVSVARDS
ncbi:hypothetical protein R4B61_02725 [Fructilactobacillus vespulae]|uniref:hypothetical protein n=1 Tax=Fructilactobacillus vespulae TaxID=1249630 RepID=UPI0039B4258A